MITPESVLVPDWMALRAVPLALKVLFGESLAPVTRSVVSVAVPDTVTAVAPVRLPDAPLPICNVPALTVVAPA